MRSVGNHPDQPRQGLQLLMGVWCTQPLSITLTGITNESTDPGVDIWRTVSFPLIR